MPAILRWTSKHINGCSLAQGPWMGPEPMPGMHIFSLRSCTETPKYFLQLMTPKLSKCADVVTESRAGTFGSLELELSETMSLLP